MKVSVETHLKIRRSLETEVREAQSRISELQQQAHNFGGVKSNMTVELQGEAMDGEKDEEFGLTVVS